MMMPPMPLRELVKQAYKSKKWAEKVDRMTDAQVFVLFIKFKNNKKI